MLTMCVYILTSPGGGAGRTCVALVDKWTAMLVVLEAKFRDPVLRAALLSTGSALLLEHNSETGRDAFWSDDHDGSGANHLGRALMFLRRRLAREEGTIAERAAWPTGLDPHLDVASSEWGAMPFWQAKSTQELNEANDVDMGVSHHPQRCQKQ